MDRQTFALFFGHRGFFPERLIAAARDEMRRAVEGQGHQTLMMAAAGTPHGAVEGAAEGRLYARFLEQHRGQYDGVIVCLPNFGDETGAVAALQHCGVPILIQAYPDEIGKMGFAERRDAFCGKLSVMDVFHQYGLAFTTLQPHTVHPEADGFVAHLRQFAATCRVVKGMRAMVVGALGARTTAFKTVRFDELTLQQHGITCESIDLAEIISRVRAMVPAGAAYEAKAAVLKDYTRWHGVPDQAFQNLVKLGVVIDQLIDAFDLDALALRCWLELEQQLHVAPCVLLSELNNRRIPAACELDVCNAVAMHALALAARQPATCLDWNNNYGDDPNKCVLFHCGPVPQDLMRAKGQVIDHPMFAKVLGAGHGYGPNVGRIKSGPMTFASAKTENGKLVFYVGEGTMTDDEIEQAYFGCAGVARIDGLQEKLQRIGYRGYRHHVSMTFSQVAAPMREAFERYLKYEVDAI